MISGKETESPRGRIYLARSAAAGTISWKDTAEALDTCLGCRACEPACPSGVHYGEILEQARERLEAERPQRVKHLLLKGITNPSLLRLQTLLPGRRVPGFVSRFLAGEASEADKPKPQGPSGWAPLNESELPAVRGEVYMLEGCAMRVLFPRVHEATRRLLRRTGFVVKESEAGCCGALHAHNGFLAEARTMAEQAFKAWPGELPIVVNSAGCGSWLKDQGSARIVDITEFLLAQGLAGVLETSPGIKKAATYHDACHLAHGQGVRSQPRQLLAAVPGLTLTRMAESDMCCGSAGIYNLTEPSRARSLLDRKWANIAGTKAELVILGNPGCHAWIEQAARENGSSVRVLHTAELLEASFSGLP